MSLLSQLFEISIFGPWSENYICIEREGGCVFVSYELVHILLVKDE